jgi:RND family efflux transporter MFP subunit
MLKKSIVLTGVVLLVLGVMTWFAYKELFSSGPYISLKTQKAEKRDIHKVVFAEGSLEANETSKLGPLITAKVKKIYVKEGQKITKGQLLADLENDKGGDTDVRLTRAQLEQAQATRDYCVARHERNKALYESGELAQDTYDKSCETYLNAQAEVSIKQAVHDKEIYLFDQTRVLAPHDGIIAAIGIEEGETVSPGASPPKILFSIVQDLQTMKATLYIDESKIGDVVAGMTTEISVDTYPYKQPWTAPITKIGMSKACGQGDSVKYKAEVLINNKENLLRPGMTVHAKTLIAEENQVLAVPGFVFQLNGKVLEAVAKKMNYSCTPLSSAQKKELAPLQAKHPVKTLWVVEGKAFIEKVVEIGLTDNAYFQILSGIKESDEIIADDMTASDEMKKIAKHVAGG